MKKVKCLFCGYEWETKSKMFFVSCPSCLKKTKIKGGGRNEHNKTK